ncbi:unnamed protein product, partial [Rotaria magnacalcarata]
DLPQAIRIKLITKDSLSNINGHELRLMGIVERDANDVRLERNGRSNEASETKQTNGNDTVSSS